MALMRRLCPPSRAIVVKRAGLAPGRKRCRKLQSSDQTCGIGTAGPGDVEGGAVIGGRAHEWQAQRDVDGVVEGERLNRDQRLVVIHRKRHVVAGPCRFVKQGVGRQWTARN